MCNLQSNLPTMPPIGTEGKWHIREVFFIKHKIRPKGEKNLHEVTIKSTLHYMHVSPVYTSNLCDNDVIRKFIQQRSAKLEVLRACDRVEDEVHAIRGKNGRQLTIDCRQFQPRKTLN